MGNKRIGLILGIFMLVIVCFSAWSIKSVYEIHGDIPLWYELWFISAVAFAAFGLSEGVSPKNRWKVVLPVLLITCLIVLSIPSTSESTEFRTQFPAPPPSSHNHLTNIHRNHPESTQIAQRHATRQQNNRIPPKFHRVSQKNR